MPSPAARQNTVSDVDMMIVGGQKAGTSTLLRYLGRHPAIEAQRRPEMTYFSDPTLSSQPFEAVAGRYFEQPSKGALLRLGKLAGLMYDQEALERLHQHNPGATVVVILRDPVARAYSAFWHARVRGREPLASFEEALDGDPGRFATEKSRFVCQYVQWSCYAPYVQRIRELFPPDNVHVLFLEELTSDPRAAVSPLLARWALEPSELPPELPHDNASRAPRSTSLARIRQSRSARALLTRVLPLRLRDVLRQRYLRLNERRVQVEPLSPETERRLRALFEGPNLQLVALLGRDLPDSWSGG